MHTEQSFEHDLALAWPKLALTKPTYYEQNYFATVRHIEGEKRLDEEYKDYLRQPQQQRSYGAQYAWLIYRNASQSQLNSLLLGSADLRKVSDRTTPILANFGTTSVVPKANTHKKLEELRQKGLPTADEQLGSILSEKNWWPMFNDAWLLGGVHKLARFYLARARAPEAHLVWNADKQRPRILGRELIGLKTFGYKRVVNRFQADLGLVFAASDISRSLTAKFTALCAAVDACQGAEEILEYIRDDTVNYEAYDTPLPAPTGEVRHLAQPYIAYEASLLESTQVFYTVSGTVALTGQRSGQYVQCYVVQGSLTRHAVGYTNQTITSVDFKRHLIYLDQAFLG